MVVTMSIVRLEWRTGCLRYFGPSVDSKRKSFWNGADCNDQCPPNLFTVYITMLLTSGSQVRASQGVPFRGSTTDLR